MTRSHKARCGICGEKRSQVKCTMATGIFDEFDLRARGGRYACNHRACMNCLCTYVGNVLQTSTLVTCPFPGCPGQLTAVDLERIGGPLMLASYQAKMAAEVTVDSIEAYGNGAFFCQRCLQPIFKDGGCRLVKCTCGWVNLAERSEHADGSMLIIVVAVLVLFIMFFVFS